MKFDYIADMKDSIRDYLKDTDERDFDKLYDEMWADDSITNNMTASGGAEAKQHVLDNMDTLMQACAEFGTDYAVLGEKFMNEDYGCLDATIRCYLLAQALEEVLEEEMKEDE